jgi:putative flavoprotein involved in K+ transport
LATSWCLTEAGIDHVVLERGRTAERWLGHRWESLRLLTPNWASRLPGWSYRGPHPDGYMTAVDLAAYLTAYAGSFDAPIEAGHDVRELVRTENGFTVRTSDTSWAARNVVMATGWCDRPRVPGFAERLAPAVAQITPSAYAKPDLLPDGRVVVVGASATGVQIADELARAGREVVLAVGRHSRVPRRYRGMDIWWWLDQIGTFERTIDEMEDPYEARHEGALQLVGRDDHRDVDLPALQRLGVRVTGRLTDADGDDLAFADDVQTTTSAADERLRRLLVRIDDHIDASGLAREVLSADTPARLGSEEPITRLHARRDGIAAVVWATGYRRTYPWLRVPVLDPSGEIVQRRGVTPVAGLYVVGQRHQHRRDSNFIDGVRHDASFVVRHIAGRVDRPAAPSLSHEEAS